MLYDTKSGDTGYSLFLTDVFRVQISAEFYKLWTEFWQWLMFPKIPSILPWGKFGINEHLL